MKIHWKKIMDIKKIETKLSPLVPIHDKMINSEQKLIVVKNLMHSYGVGKNKKIIYENINFNIYDGEILAILGSNGAGKTTIVEVISGIRKQTSGEVFYLYNKDDGNYEKVGVQFQDLSFPNGVSTKDIITFIVNMNNNNFDEKMINTMLERFHLKDLINMQVKKLSGGQQQRLNVMISMLSKPKVLFLDEFTTGLDINIKNDIKKFILEFSREYKIVVVIISHDIDIINEMVTRFIVLAENKLMVNAYRATIEEKFGSISKFLKIYIR